MQTGQFVARLRRGLGRRRAGALLSETGSSSENTREPIADCHSATELERLIYYLSTCSLVNNPLASRVPLGHECGVYLCFVSQAAPAHVHPVRTSPLWAAYHTTHVSPIHRSEAFVY